MSRRVIATFAAAVAAASIAVAAPAPAAWEPRQTADLIVLNKVDAKVTQVAAPVGQSVQFGSLTIKLRSCLVRPPTMRADAAAYLDITDSHRGAPEFHGWMMAQEPAVATLENPVFDVRLAGCR